MLQQLGIGNTNTVFGLWTGEDMRQDRRAESRAPLSPPTPTAPTPTVLTPTVLTPTVGHRPAGELGVTAGIPCCQGGRGPLLAADSMLIEARERNPS